jgi:hypothetical protein
LVLATENAHEDLVGEPRLMEDRPSAAALLDKAGPGVGAQRAVVEGVGLELDLFAPNSSKAMRSATRVASVP